jgi:membrane protease YdiL (CAAX protease family)
VDYPFHRLARTAPNYRWWRPLVTGLIGFGFFLGFTVVLTIVFVALVFLIPGQQHLLNDLVAYRIDNSQPLILGLTLASVAVLLPSVWLARRIMGPRPTGLIASVVGRLRWRWMLWLAIPVVVAFGLSTVFSFFVQPLFGGDAPRAVVTPNTWPVVIVSLLLVPVQAAAEEFVFRGYLMQTIGGWLKHPLFAILIPIPFFTFSHAYDVWGMIDVSVFALSATYLTWRTGGLEASIAAHTVNNTVIFIVGAFGLVDVNSKTSDWTGPTVTLVTMAIYAAIVVALHKRLGLARVRTVTPPPPPTGQPYVFTATPPPPTGLPYGVTE